MNHVKNYLNPKRDELDYWGEDLQRLAFQYAHETNDKRELILDKIFNKSNKEKEMSEESQLNKILDLQNKNWALEQLLSNEKLKGLMGDRDLKLDDLDDGRVRLIKKLQKEKVALYKNILCLEERIKKLELEKAERIVNPPPLKTKEYDCETVDRGKGKCICKDQPYLNMCDKNTNGDYVCHICGWIIDPPEPKRKLNKYKALDPSGFYIFVFADRYEVITMGMYKFYRFYTDGKMTAELCNLKDIEI